MDSKQITFVDYDDQKAEITLFYHTGQIRRYCPISQEEYLQFLGSANKYDYLVELTSKNKKKHPK